MAARGGAAGRGTALQAERSRVRFPMEFFIVNPYGRTMALGSTQPLTETVPAIFPGVKAAGVWG
jgi:hypothetical protein